MSTHHETETRNLLAALPAVTEAQLRGLQARLADRASADWDRITSQVNEHGCALTPQLMTPAECERVAKLYDSDEYFRSTIDMSRYRFGEGEYRYFKRPFPEPIEPLKQALYPHLLPIARDWYGKLRRAAPWPETLDEWLEWLPEPDVTAALGSHPQSGLPPSR